MTSTSSGPYAELDNLFAELEASPEPWQQSSPVLRAAVMATLGWMKAEHDNAQPEKDWRAAHYQAFRMLADAVNRNDLISSLDLK